MNVIEFYSLFLQCRQVQIDSRKVEPRDLFFAFSGENYDAAQEAQSAIEKGALAVIVENQKFENTQKHIYYVESTLVFLQELAIYHRQNLSIPLIGLTGSNGKTTSKELIHAVLSTKYNVQYTKGNLNNHIGVPLSILSINFDHEIAVIEMGANHPKEIAKLCQIAQPTIGYITNFGKAHLEGFGGLDGVINAKSELYDYLLYHMGLVLVNEKDSMQIERTQNMEKISFGLSSSDYFFESFSQDYFQGIVLDQQKILSQLTGDYNFTNLCAATSFGIYFDIPTDSIKWAIENYQPSNMRSQVLQKNAKVLLLDAYNANPSSMEVSLKNFATYQGTKSVILGDMLEIGSQSLSEHQKIVDLISCLLFDQVILVGKEFANTQHDFVSLPTSADLIEYLKLNPIQSKNILLKGSRGIALEEALVFLN